MATTTPRPAGHSTNERQIPFLENGDWDVFENKIQWLINQGGELTPLSVDQHQSFKSITFPGLWLNASALLAGKLKEVRASVEAGTATPEHALFVKTLEEGSQQK